MNTRHRKCCGGYFKIWTVTALLEPRSFAIDNGYWPSGSESGTVNVMVSLLEAVTGKVLEPIDKVSCVRNATPIISTFRPGTICISLSWNGGMDFLPLATKAMMTGSGGRSI